MRLGFLCSSREVSLLISLTEMVILSAASWLLGGEAAAGLAEMTPMRLRLANEPSGMSLSGDFGSRGHYDFLLDQG